MPNQTAFGYPYPILSDAVHPASVDIKALAEKIQEANETPFIKLSLPSNFSVANNDLTIRIPFGAGSETFKSHPSLHDVSTLNTRVIPNKPGIYGARGTNYFAANGTGNRSAYIAKNGVRQGPEDIRTGSSSPSVTAFWEGECNGTTDYLELGAFQTSGGGLNVTGDGNPASVNLTVFVVWFIRPLIV